MGSVLGGKAWASIAIPGFDQGDFFNYWGLLKGLGAQFFCLKGFEPIR